MQGNHHARRRKPADSIAPVRVTRESDTISCSSEEEEPLSPGARVFQEPQLNCHIISLIGFKTSIDVDVIKTGLQHTLLRHPRFSSKVVERGGTKKWVRTTVNSDDHIVAPDVGTDIEAADKYIEDYVSNLTKTSVDFSKPLWEIHLLNIKTSDANAVAILRLHHSLGDGASLISLLLSCCRKTSDPSALPTLPIKKQLDPLSDSTGFFSILVSVWLICLLVWNTLVDVLLFIATIAFLKDTKTPVNARSSIGLTSKRIVHRTLSMDDIKLVKNAMGATVNDVVVGVTQAGISRYLNRRYGDLIKYRGDTGSRNNLPGKIRFRSALLVNVRPSAGIEDLSDMVEQGKFRWGNWIGYMLLPFVVSMRNNPLDYVREAKTSLARKKLSLEALLTYKSVKFLLEKFGEERVAALTSTVLSNTSMSFSNVVGPVEEISFCGHPLTYIAPTVYGHPHALTIHFQSYADKVTMVVAVDEGAIPDPHSLCHDLEESLQAIKIAVAEEP